MLLAPTWLMKRHRTKLLLSVLLCVIGTLTYLGYRGPASDRRFLLGCLVVTGVFVFALIISAPIVRCPRCDRDMGYFLGLGPLRRMRLPRPRYVACKRCGCVVDRWNDSREVE